jgi:hypothetical protein
MFSPVVLCRGGGLSGGSLCAGTVWERNKTISKIVVSRAAAGFATSKVAEMPAVAQQMELSGQRKIRRSKLLLERKFRISCVFVCVKVGNDTEKRAI